MGATPSACGEERKQPSALCLYRHTHDPAAILWRGLHDLDEYEKIEFDRLSYTAYPVYKLPAHIIDYLNPSQEYSVRSPHNA